MKNKKTRMAISIILTAVLTIQGSMMTGFIKTDRVSAAEGDAGTYCGQEAHTHDEEDCYTKKLICEKEETGHTHTEDCYETVSTLICGLEETSGHHHNDSCYQTIPSQLICGQEETAGHHHSDSCYQVIPSQLICGQEESEEHTHTGSCWSAEERILVCGQEESDGHTHSATCWSAEERVLSCGQEESDGHTHTDACYQTEKVLTCGKEESKGHEHTDKCYEKELTCKKEEHEHTLSCYSNPNANVESVGVWESTLPKSLTGIWAEDVVLVAKSQLGYTESAANYEVVNEKTGKKKGYTRYGAWYGDPYGDWCAMFASFCLHYAGVPTSVMPEDANVVSWIQSLRNRGLYAEKSSGYQPTSGDLVYFAMGSQGADHVGIIESTSFSHDEDGNTHVTGITTIEGNSGNAVRENYYSVSDSRILGFGVLAGQTGIDEETSEEWEETLPDLTGDATDNVLLIADSQLGYSESKYNFTLSSDWSRNGYTRYGDWYDSSYEDWNTMFVSFCLSYADVDLETASEASELLDAMKDAGIYKEADDYVPEEGDIVFFTQDGRTADRTAIVEKVDTKISRDGNRTDVTLTVIEGDCGDTVCETDYDSSDVLGYGVLSGETVMKRNECYDVNHWESSRILTSGTEEEWSAGRIMKNYHGLLY